MYLAELLEKEKVVCVVYIGELASKGKSCHNRKFANNGEIMMVAVCVHEKEWCLCVRARNQYK